MQLEAAEASSLLVLEVDIWGHSPGKPVFSLRLWRRSLACLLTSMGASNPRQTAPSLLSLTLLFPQEDFTNTPRGFIWKLDPENAKGCWENQHLDGPSLWFCTQSAHRRENPEHISCICEPAHTGTPDTCLPCEWTGRLRCAEPRIQPRLLVETCLN